MILDCGLIELVQNVVTMRSVILNCYDAIGVKVSKATFQALNCSKHIFYNRSAREDFLCVLRIMNNTCSRQNFTNEFCIVIYSVAISISTITPSSNCIAAIELSRNYKL